MALCVLGTADARGMLPPEALPDHLVECGGTGRWHGDAQQPLQSLASFEVPAKTLAAPKRAQEPIRNGERGVRGRTTGALSALVIFAKFRGEASGDNAKPPWADDLFDESLPGSFSHFYREMSRGQLRVQGQVLPRRYSSLEPAASYLAQSAGASGDFARFNLEILTQADADTDLGLFDNDGPDEIPNSGDDDGYVDVVFINLLTVPRDFLIGSATGLASLGLDNDYISDDVAAVGGQVRVRSRFSGFGGTTQRGHVFTITAASMCHEFGHVLGLPDLFDQSSVFRGDELVPEEDSAGIGKWGLMGLGTLGWGVEDGPNAFCAWSLAQLGWVGENNSLLLDVDESLSDLIIEPIDEGGAVYRIPVTEDEYFLIENRQSSGSYYNRNIPQGGLLVWHADEQSDNDEERHKQVDLICADGLFADRGFPGGEPDPVSGRDNLDFWSRDDAYAVAHNGNQGDATDPFDGNRYTRINLTTNPAFSAHAGFRRAIPLGVALEDIRDAGGGSMELDLFVRQPSSGNIARDTTWSGEIAVAGDIIVEPGATLTMAPGTLLSISRGDNRGLGFDSGNSELIVFGNLVLQGDSESPVALRSSASRPGADDWLGLLLMSGGNETADDALASGSLVVENASYGMARQRLPAGTTVWTGRRDVPWDLIVPADGELVIEEGARIRFTPEDLSGRGANSALTELVVGGDLVIAGRAGNEAQLTVASSRSDALWYGLVMKPGATIAAAHAAIDQCGFVVTGEASTDGALTLSDATVQRCANGLSVIIFGEAVIDRATFTGLGGAAIRAQGTGLLRVRSTVITDSGREGISLGNTSLEAIDTRIEQSGQLDVGEDPRSGISAAGGRGQKLELWNCVVTGNSQHGLQLEGWQGEVELHGTEISANSRNGLNGSGMRRMVFEDAVVARNFRDGAAFARTAVEVWTTRFEENVGTGLVLEASTGLIENSHFRNNAGLSLDEVTALEIRTSTFANGSFGLRSESSAPSLVGNRFENNLIGIDVGGRRVPVRIEDNSFIGNRRAIGNSTALTIPAQRNYWGTTDSSAIAAMLLGEVDWTPFLPSEPLATAIADSPAGAPQRFWLHHARPNPFNSQTQIRFDLPRPSSVSLAVYDMRGVRIRNLVAGRRLDAGIHEIDWNGRNDGGRGVASGVYLLRLRADLFLAVRKTAVVR